MIMAPFLGYLFQLAYDRDVEEETPIVAISI